MKRDNLDLSYLLNLGPITISADNTPTTIDLVDAGSADIVLLTGVGGITFDGTNRIEWKVTPSDDDSSYAAVATGDVILKENCDASVGAGGIVRSHITAHAAASFARASYVGGKRYVRVLADFFGTHGAGTPLAVVAVRSRLAIGGDS